MHQLFVKTLNSLYIVIIDTFIFIVIIDTFSLGIFNANLN